MTSWRHAVAELEKLQWKLSRVAKIRDNQAKNVADLGTLIIRFEGRATDIS